MEEASGESGIDGSPLAVEANAAIDKGAAWQATA
jgi:hypothetical protein